jgi:excisionase family DNA binding protein
MKALEPLRSPTSRQLIDMLIDAIADVLIDRLECRQSTRNRVLNAEKAAEYLGISEDQIYKLVSDRKLTPVRFDRRLRFDIRELDRLVEESMQR